MVSRPSFDPNQFSVRVSHSYWNSILENPDHPLLNKAIQAQLAPGSTFKIIMSVAGLEEGVAQNLHVNCQGGGTFYGQFHACDAHHGAVDIHNAIPYSCDTYYYTLADKLGIDTIAKYATAAGLAQRTGIDLPNEAVGTMPSTAWKLKTQHERWYPSEAISVGIGQGAVTASPIQLARTIGGIASGGVMHRPHVILGGQIDHEMESAILDSFPGSGEKTIQLAADNWQIITDGMAAVTTSGTAATAHLDGIDFAGKTGTAQVMSHAALAFAKKGQNTEANAWFVGVAPRRNPDIAVAVLFEHGKWGKYSALIGAQVVNAFVTKQRAHDHNLKIADTPETKPATAPATPPSSPTTGADQ
jgi:penicillin-binding protein 2